MAMVEYLERPEETKEIFLEDGFMRTGDLGFYNEQGGFSFVDRLKEMIKYVCGQRISFLFSIKFPILE